MTGEDRVATVNGNEAKLLEVALRLIPGGAVPTCCSIEIIRTGGNNRLYRVVLKGKRYLLKQYFRHEGDVRDRLAAEFSFSKFAWENGIRCIAEPIGKDRAASVGMYGYIDGNNPAPGEIGAPEISQALDFFVRINRSATRHAASFLPLASEACFSIGAHMVLVEGRVRRLSDIPSKDELDCEARNFAANDLKGKWEEVRKFVAKEADRAGIYRDAILSPGDRVLSPSDFGFHNAMRTGNGMKFIDFEYAGWDDPAKTTCDFFNQVAVPVPIRFFREFSETVAGCVQNREAAIRRAELLFPLFAVKWVCIVMNHFLPVGRDRKRFAGQEVETMKKGQLALARSLLAGIEVSNRGGR